MTFTLSEQMFALLFAVILGAFLGLLYVLVKALRIVFKPSKSLLFIFDFLYMTICTFCTGLFSMAYSLGDTRYFTVIGEVFGFLLIYFTLGKVSIYLFEKTYSYISKKVNKILDFMGKTAKKLLKLMCSIMYNKHRLVDVFKRRGISPSESLSE